jgi:hypothetical protein
MPNVDVRLVGKEVGPVVTEGGTLLLGVSYTVAETPIARSGTCTRRYNNPRQMVDDDVLDLVAQGTRELKQDLAGARKMIATIQIVTKLK